MLLALAFYSLTQSRVLTLGKPAIIASKAYDVKVLDVDLKSGGYAESICEESKIILTTGGVLWEFDGTSFRQIPLPKWAVAADALPQHGMAPATMIIQGPKDTKVMQLSNSTQITIVTAVPGHRFIQDCLQQVAVGVEVTPKTLKAAFYADGKVRILPSPFGNSEALRVQKNLACGYVMQKGRRSPARWLVGEKSTLQILPVPAGILGAEALGSDGTLTIGGGSSLAALDGQNIVPEKGLLWEKNKLLAWKYGQSGKNPELNPQWILNGVIIGNTRSKTIEGQYGFIAKKDRVFLVPDITVRKSHIHIFDVVDLDENGDFLCNAMLLQKGKGPHAIVCFLKPMK